MSEEENATHWQLRYHEAVMECLGIRIEKDREYSKLVATVVIISFILFALWLHHEGQWERRLATAQSFCTLPESDGSCAMWDRAALGFELRRLGR